MARVEFFKAQRLRKGDSMLWQDAHQQLGSIFLVTSSISAA